MCGIAGAVEPEGLARAELVRAMTRALSHRGPDDEGLIVRGPCALGHRRLSIVDLDGGHQPLANEDGSVWVVFNGEIYNHAAIRRDLEARGHTFRTRSDTEVLVHAYEEDGPRLVERLRGMFAFAIWDARQQRLLLARDRLGIKPLYYAHDAASGRLAFASELRPLLLDGNVDRSIDPAAAAGYLALRYVPAPRTFVRGVRKLPPGSLLVWDAPVSSTERPRMRVERYWDLAEQATCDLVPPSEAEAASRLRDLVDDCVEMRLMSEVPLGAFLSGGVDSTLVTASMLARHKGERLKTFAVGYEDEERSSELAWAALAARHLGTEHHEVHVSGDEAARALPEIAWALDEPVADPAAVPLYFLSRRAREEVTVVLSGEGGDEILGGYASYQWNAKMERLRAVGGGPASHLAAALAPSPRWRRAARLLGLPLERRYRGVSRAFDDEGRWRLRGGDDAAGDAALLETLAPVWAQTRGMSTLRRMLHLDTSVWLPDDLLMKADKITMASAIELRVPLLDHHLVSYAWSLPDRLKVSGGEGKRVLRRSAIGRVPQQILDRPKQGFATPTTEWLRKGLLPTLREVVLDTRMAQALGGADYDRAHVEGLVKRHVEGADCTPELWSLLVLGLWHRRAVAIDPVVDGRSGRPADPVAKAS